MEQAGGRHAARGSGNTAAGVGAASAASAAGAAGHSAPSSVKHLSREDLEDRYLRLKESHQEMKKLTKSQEEKMKRMATKLIRLTNDFKKEKQVSAVDVDSRDAIEDLRHQVQELKQKNEAVVRKLQICRQELDSKQRTGPYRSVAARIDTGISRPSSKPRSDQHEKPAKAPGVQHSPPPPMVPRYGHSLLEEERIRTMELQQIILELEMELEHEKSMMAAVQDEHTEKTKLQHAHHSEDMEKLKQALIETQRKNISDDVSLIKLQREVREKCAQLEALQTKYLTAEHQVEKLKVNHTNVLSELTGAQERLQTEEDVCQQLHLKLASQKLTKSTVVELQEMVEDLRTEKKLLQDANDKLLSSVFDVRQEEQHKAQIQLLQDRISLLESGKRQALVAKRELLEQLEKDKAQLSIAHKSESATNLRYFTLKEEHEKLSEKMEFFSTESSVNFTELEEALVFIKTRKLKGGAGMSMAHNGLEDVDALAAGKRKVESELHRLQTVYTETRQDLEKTRHLLKLQMRITSDMDVERQTIEKRLFDVEAESEERAKDHDDAMARSRARIKRLEHQLHDMAYGTKQLRVLPSPTDDTDVEGTLKLQPGQNCLQIHLGETGLTDDGREALGDSLPALCFLSLECLDFEVAITSTVANGRLIDFNFTADYTVTMDDFFIYCLSTVPCKVELHGADGASWSTLAAGQLQLRDLLSDVKQDRLHGSITLIGDSPYTGIPMATVKLWTRLCCPVDRTLRLYQKRVKALGYVSANKNATHPELEDVGVPSPQDSSHATASQLEPLQPASNEQLQSTDIREMSAGDIDMQVADGLKPPKPEDDGGSIYSINENDASSSEVLTLSEDDEDADDDAGEDDDAELHGH